MELSTILIGAGGLLLGGVLKGATGAGAPIIAVPLLALAGGVPFAVAIFSIPNLVTNIWQGWAYRAHHVSFTLSRRYGIAGAVGAVFGTAVLASAPERALALTIAVVTLVYVVFRIVQPDVALPLRQAERWAPVVGVAAGGLMTVAGVAAPLSITFLNAVRMERAAFVATISWFFAGAGIVQVPSLILWGVMTAELAFWSALAVLPVLAGMPLGEWLARRMSRAAFERLILTLLVLLAIRLAAGALLW